MMYMFGSTMGCFYSMEWFSLLLFNLMMQKMDVLKNILMAITTNLKMLGMLSLLGNSFIYFRYIIHFHFLDLFYSLLRKFSLSSINSKGALLISHKLYYWTLHSLTNRWGYGLLWIRKIHFWYALHNIYGPAFWKHCWWCPYWYICWIETKRWRNWARQKR